MTRDAKVAEAISDSEEVARRLRDELLQLEQHALTHNATAHAGLYEAVAAHLSSATKDLGRAHQIMLNGDPEDYAPREE